MRGFVFLLALSTAGCNLFGPSTSVEGKWYGRLPKFYYVCLTLQQDGDTITGTATAVSDGFLLYSGVPVRGEHPDLAFTVDAAHTAPCCAHMAGTVFIGEQDRHEKIDGTYGNGSITFNRDDGSIGDQCTATRTAP